MEQIQENEQWRLNGNCEKCRKNNYCSKTCTRHDRRIRAETRSELKGLVAENDRWNDERSYLQNGKWNLVICKSTVNLEFSGGR